METRISANVMANPCNSSGTNHQKIVNQVALKTK